MATASTGVLRPLSDINMAIADRRQDIRGRKVYDASGAEIGEVDDLLIDDAEKRVRFLQIASGGFLGIGVSHCLLPVEAVTRITDDAVHIDQTRDRISGAPRYNPSVVDERYLDRLYGYYGYDPYWKEGYRYPAYPPL